MRILITGSRTWSDAVTIAVELAAFDPPAGTPKPTLVSGHCLPRRAEDPPGADLLCEQEATDLGWHIEHHPAAWTAPCPPTCPPQHRRRSSDGVEYCPMAGPRRNQHMVSLGAQICLAFDLGTRGTGRTISAARRAGIPVRIIRPGMRFVASADPL